MAQEQMFVVVCNENYPGHIKLYCTGWITSFVLVIVNGTGNVNTNCLV